MSGLKVAGHETKEKYTEFGAANAFPVKPEFYQAFHIDKFFLNAVQVKVNIQHNHWSSL